MSNFWSINLISNIRKFYLVSFFEALWFPLPIFILYLLDSGLDLGRVGILLSVLVIVQVIFEIPSSIWADRYSRKNILIIGYVFITMSNLILFAKDSFEYFFIAMIFMGFSGALRSGTDSAIVYDTLLNLGEEKKYDKTQSKIMVCFFWSRIVASVAGALVYSIGIRLPFLLAIFSSLGAMAVLFFVKEPSFHKSIGSHFGQVKDGLKFLMKEKNVWLVVVSFSLMLATSDVLFYYYQPVLT
ncbi:MAG: MFS transporter, partial [Minisyncoccia bacterium]